MAKSLGNTKDLFDWNEVISWCEKDGGTASGLVQAGDDYMDYWNRPLLNEENTLESEMNDYWHDLIGCGYRWDLIWWQWIGTDPYKEFINKFSKHIKVKHLKSFVSRLDPGNVAPPHWDECDIELVTPTNEGKIFRYIVFLNDPDPGQAFLLKDYCHYNEKAGELYLWDYYRDFHAAFNTGSKPQYLFHFIGTTDGYQDE